jgi:hypothetical protein
MSIIVRARPIVKPSALDFTPDGPSFEPSEEDRAWAAYHLNADCVDFDVIEDEGLEWPGTRDEFERWLDAIAPTEEEREHRDRCDASLAHED